MAACSSAHLNFCHLPFLHVRASHWHRLHHVQHSWHDKSSCGPFPSRAWYYLVASDAWYLSPVTPSTMCPRVYLCIHITITLQGASQIFEFGDLWQLWLALFIWLQMHTKQLTTWVAVAKWLECTSCDRGVLSSNPGRANTKFGNSIYPTLPVSFN